VLGREMEEKEEQAQGEMFSRWLDVLRGIGCDRLGYIAQTDTEHRLSLPAGSSSPRCQGTEPKAFQHR